MKPPSHQPRRRGSPSTGTDYRAEWAALQRRHEDAKQPHSQEEFEQWVQQGRTAEGREGARTRKRRSIDSEEEEEMFYPPSGYPEEWLFRLLCPSNPSRARRRVERVYWLASHSFAYGLFLSGFGVMLLVLGGLWTYYAEERMRGVGVLVAAVLLCIPGFYSLFVLLMYVQGRKGYSYRQLPED